MKIRKTIVCIMLAAAAAASLSLTGCGGIEKAKEGVVSVVEKANTLEMESDASKLDGVLKQFYSGVVTGTINSTTSGGRVSAHLPPQNASAAEKKAAANALTVYSALEEQGMTARYTDDYLMNFVSCDGAIRYKGSQAVSGKPTKPVSADSMLGDILS